MKRIAIVLVIVVAAVGATFYFRGQAAANPTTYLYVPVTRGSIQSTVRPG